MTNTPLKLLCRQVQEIAAQAGHFIRTEAGKVAPSDIQMKHHNNLVSYVDTTSEKMLVEALAKLLPEAGFLTEENTVAQNQNATLQWVIDPLDGTTNFLYQLPSYAVSVALLQHGRPVLGVVYEVNRSECFWAVKDHGAFLNQTPIYTSKVGQLPDALIGTGFPYYDFELIDAYTDILKTLMRNTKGIRRFGAAAVDLCYVACGRFDAFYEHSLHPWDVAAGSLIVQEAGGVISDFSGGNNYLFGRQIIASAPALYPRFLPLFSDIV
ncbi:inositol monophosphatase [Sphingobacteriales bacterium UPWRP_1]|nr:inositol monophosphatase [Sphingobacteriales bacterium TSM_CSS]PSJ78906.1 inositol monophosphatase [Sphingobacteriales bacterium UPWRP_1]